jgi:hypothetical protein
MTFDPYNFHLKIWESIKGVGAQVGVQKWELIWACEVQFLTFSTLMGA